MQRVTQKKSCTHPEVIREYGSEGVNVSDNQPRYYVCQKCGKKSVDIEDFRVNGEWG